MDSIGCRHLRTTPRHPCSNGAAENLVKTVKSAIASANPKTLHELETLVDNFLLQYRNATHTTTKESPAMLFKSRRLRSSLQCLDSSIVVYFRGNDLRPASGIVTRQLGQDMVEITDLNDATVHKRHMDQVHFKSSTDQRHQETSEGDSQLHTPSAHPTEPHQSDMQRQPIETQRHRQEQTEPTIAVRRSSRQASQIDEALLRKESCGDPDFRDCNPRTIRYSFMSSDHRSGSSTG
ncbi:unnamed protein product [Echinostoma caproni]|uniref:Integrase catalytic domain-containing protein n=1 Tax=Echinostoma caproni TaxID=27848 RepID=A0A183B1I0_9TREM|nr:unnamed protein product [Echinostoma caproni]